MTLDPLEVYTEIETLKERGFTATNAFKEYAAVHAAKVPTVQAAYYRHTNSLKSKPSSVADRLLVIVAEVREQESRLAGLDKVLAQLESK